LGAPTRAAAGEEDGGRHVGRHAGAPLTGRRRAHRRGVLSARRGARVRRISGTDRGVAALRSPRVVRIKRVYDPADETDGLRVLVMRLGPRGMKKERIALWLRELGADRELLREWKAGRVDWPERRRRYLAGLERPEAAAQLAELRSVVSREPVTL